MTLPGATCDGKAAYASRGLAGSVALRMRKRDEGNAQPYRCQSCHAWHVGSSIVPKRRRPGRFR